MGCFSCFEPRRQNKRPLNLQAQGLYLNQFSSAPTRKPSSGNLEREKLRSDSLELSADGSQQHIGAQTFTFRELAAATQNFKSDCLIGEGGFGRVYKGRLGSTGQVVAVKQLDLNGLQGNREFLVEVLMLSLLHHPNLVNLNGYCADGDQRLLVYEYMPLGCLEDHLHCRPSNVDCLDWNVRMKIAAGAARGLEYLHDKASPPVIYRDFKSSNILLGDDFHPKLSDFGLAKLGPVGDKTYVSTRVMGTYGYCAPEYASTGQLTVKSDVYSFGVVLLELITGRKAIDYSRGCAEYNLVAWAQPLFKDRKKFNQMADPLLCKQYPLRELHQAIAVAAMCLQDDATNRPVIGDVVTALNHLASQIYDPRIHPNNKISHSPSTNRKNQERMSDSRHRQVAEKQRFVDHLSGQGNSSSPTSNTPVNGDNIVQQIGIGRSPENGMPLKVDARSSAVNLQDSQTKNDPNGCVKEVDASTDCGVQEAISPRKQDIDDWVKFSGQNCAPKECNVTVQNSSDRERSVAEARMWGENWRDRKQEAIRLGDDNLDNILL